MDEKLAIMRMWGIKRFPMLCIPCIGEGEEIY